MNPRTGQNPNRTDNQNGRTRPIRNGGDLSKELLSAITRSLDEDQADDVTVIDLAGKTAIADYLVIASGRNPRHLGAMADHLRELIKSMHHSATPVEGAVQGDWILIDGGDVIVHLFRPETRLLYNLEKMWGVGAPGPEDGMPGQADRSGAETGALRGTGAPETGQGPAGA